MPDLVIRPAVQDDLEVLWDLLAMAAYEPDAEAAKAVPRVAKYLVGWQRPGDFEFIAEQNGEIIGAAWARRFSAEELKFHYGDEEAPKVSIGVKPNARGQGVGEKLMRAVIGEAARRGLGLCLGVRSENPARRLYERLGFYDIPRFRCPEPRWRHVDRHGTEALILILSIGRCFYWSMTCASTGRGVVKSAMPTEIFTSDLPFPALALK